MEFVPKIVIGPFTHQSVTYHLSGTSIMLPALESLLDIKKRLPDIAGVDIADEGQFLHSLNVIHFYFKGFEYLNINEIIDYKNKIDQFLDKLREQLPANLRLEPIGTPTFQELDSTTNCETAIIQLDSHLHFTSSSFRQLYRRCLNLYMDNEKTMNTEQSVLFTSNFRLASIRDLYFIQFSIIVMHLLVLFLYTAFGIRYITKILSYMVNFLPNLFNFGSIIKPPSLSPTFFANAYVRVKPCSNSNRHRKFKQSMDYDTLVDSYFDRTNVSYFGIVPTASPPTEVKKLTWANRQLFPFNEKGQFNIAELALLIYLTMMVQIFMTLMFGVVVNGILHIANIGRFLKLKYILGVLKVMNILEHYRIINVAMFIVLIFILIRRTFVFTS